MAKTDPLPTEVILLVQFFQILRRKTAFRRLNFSLQTMNVILGRMNFDIRRLIFTLRSLFFSLRRVFFRDGG
jgi:hypothetical protein